MAVKGINKNVIEITDTGSDCFERAILFLRPEKTEADSDKLHRRARQYLSSLSMRRKIIRGARPGLLVAKYGSAVAAGSLLTMMLLKI